MGRIVRDLLIQSARETFVGRTAELDILSTLLDTGPRVIFLHGIAGVGKSALLGVFTDRARAKGAAVISLDCRAMEPLNVGFYRNSKCNRRSNHRIEQAARRLQSLVSEYCWCSTTMKSSGLWTLASASVHATTS